MAQNRTTPYRERPYYGLLVFLDYFTNQVWYLDYK